jgi:hypothetical protein
MCVLHTVHTYPSPEVFRRSIGKWEGSWAEVILSNVHIIGDPVAKTVLTTTINKKRGSWSHIFGWDPEVYLYLLLINKPSVLVFHHTDTHTYFFYLPLTLSLNNKQVQ